MQGTERPPFPRFRISSPRGAFRRIPRECGRRRDSVGDWHSRNAGEMHMKRLMTVTFAAALTAPAGAAELVPGRWQGVIEVPGMPIPVSVDLSRDGGAWTGSVTMTGLPIKGAPLAG